MKNKNELVSANFNNLSFFNSPYGKGTFEIGIDERGNSFEKLTYDNGVFWNTNYYIVGNLR